MNIIINITIIIICQYYHHIIVISIISAAILQKKYGRNLVRWRHEMETLSVLALC